MINNLKEILRITRKHKVWTGIIAFLLFFFLVGVIGNASKNTNSNNKSSSGSNAGILSTNTDKGSNSSASTSSSSATTTSVPYTVGDAIKINSLSVTLTQVIDPASGADEFNQPESGNKLVAAVFSITNDGSQTYNDDINSDATVIGSDTQAYSYDTDNVSECTNFNEGEYTLAPGDTESGCAVFQLPQDVSVSKVQFKASGGYGNGGEWTVN